MSDCREQGIAYKEMSFETLGLANLKYLLLTDYSIAIGKTFFHKNRHV